MLVAVVVIGRIERIGKLTVRLVPSMVLLYLFMTVTVMFNYAAEIPATLLLIITDAFTGQAAAGGSIGAVILIGVRRGAFPMRQALALSPWPMVRPKPPSLFARALWPWWVR